MGVRPEILCGAWKFGRHHGTLSDENENETHLKQSYAGSVDCMKSQMEIGEVSLDARRLGIELTRFAPTRG